MEEQKAEEVEPEAVAAEEQKEEGVSASEADIVVVEDKADKGEVSLDKHEVEEVKSKPQEETGQTSQPEAEAKVEEKKADNTAKEEKKEAAMASSSLAAQFGDPIYPSPEWLKKWKQTLLLSNIKTCITQTYNKAIVLRNQILEDEGVSTNN